MQIVPSIDIADGQCVRLFKGDYGKKSVYAVTPAEMAQKSVDSGARSLHVVDLDGAKNGSVINWNAIEGILAIRDVEVQVGGGIRTEEEISRLLGLGANRVVLGSTAVQSIETVVRWAGTFGPERFCVALDLRDGKLSYQGWTKKSDRTLQDVVGELSEAGISRFLSTDIRRDGTLEGPNVGLYASLVHEFPTVQWFASGGVRSAEDIRALKVTGVAGAIVGKALFEGKVRMEDLLEAAC